MKNQFLSMAIFLLGCSFLWSACNKIKDAAKINIEMSSSNIDFTIPTITATGPANLAAKDVYLNVDSIIQANNSKLSANYIRTVHIKSCVITMLDGDANNNFSALQSCKVDFSSNVNTNLYTLAEITNNPDTESYLLDVPVNTTINLKDYFKATNFSYSITGNARKTTSKDIQCKATIKYTLEAGL